MTFHVVALPHTNVNRDHFSCAFNQKVLKFCKMMKDLGHTVYLYSSEKTDAEFDEHITCITEKDRKASLQGKHYTQASFDYSLPHWVKFNEKVIEGIKERIKDKDFICVIGGLAHKQVADAFPGHMTVEFGIGYGGTFSKYRVFESYAWMHTVYGAQMGTNAARGEWFDAVIPSYFDPADFPLVKEKQDYFLYIGRITEDKGYHIAVEVCKRLKKRLIIAGHHEPVKGEPMWIPEYGEYVHELGPARRAKFMSEATAVFVPTLYIEPFGSVAVEAQLCGTPVITTDWGAFTETVVQGVTGMRCRNLEDFINATYQVKHLQPEMIRNFAIRQYSMDSVAMRYEDYFKRLMKLWGEGWYELSNMKE